MKINRIDIQNFRKLKNCRVVFSEEKIIFVGANNSGKTSAMDALMSFLKKSKQQNISTHDFTLSNWSAIDQLASDWINIKDGDNLNLNTDSWWPHIPTLDVWRV